MKKVFKIIGIIVIVIIALVIAYQVFIVISDKIDDNNVIKEQEKLQEERRNAKTLMEYVKTHDSKYIQCENGNDCNTYNMEFTKKDFKCDALDKDIKFLGNNYIITKDNEIYDISFDELYSNNQKCKKRDIDINIKDIKFKVDGAFGGIKFISDDNKLYNENLSKIDDSFEFITVESKVYQDNNIIGIYGSIDSDTIEYNGWNNKDKHTLMVLKKDNKIYKQTYYDIVNFDTKKHTYTLEKEEFYKSLEEYGNIQYIDLSYYYLDSNGNNRELKEKTITTIISDKGYYYLDEVKTDECTKYKDIECKLELKESEIYKKFSKDIKFIGEQYTILSDNSIIETRYLTYPLDKDLRN